MADPSYPGGMIVEAETREAETACAMGILGIENWRMWPYLDTMPNWDSIRMDLSSWLMTNNPSNRYDIIFAPAGEEDGHEQHTMIGRIADDVFGRENVVHYLTYTKHGRSIWGQEVQFEPEWVEKKLRALACYKSQILHPATRHHFVASLKEYIVA